MDCSLKDVLVFVSGADRMPVLGFKKNLSIHFHEGYLATSSTCALQLHLPTIHGHDYNKFKDAMILSLLGNDGFGTI